MDQLGPCQEFGIFPFFSEQCELEIIEYIHNATSQQDHLHLEKIATITLLTRQVSSTLIERRMQFKSKDACRDDCNAF